MLEVDSSDLVEPGDALAGFGEGLARFKEWTGRTETCVQEVRLVEELEDAGGAYDPKDHVITLSNSAHSGTTLHEFCHSLDHEEGTSRRWASEQGWDLLDPYTNGLDWERYPDETTRIREAFARFCDDGPQFLTMLEDLHDVCGIEGPVEAGEFVREVAFPNAATTEWEELGTTFAYDIASDQVEGGDREGDTRLVSTVKGDVGLFVLDYVVVRDDTSGEGVVEPSLHLVDLVRAEILDTLPLAAYDEPQGNTPVAQYALVGSSTAPILYAISGDEAGTAWRVETDPLRLEVVDWPNLGEGSTPVGFEQEGQALLQAEYAGPLLRVDLTAGTVEEVDLGDLAQDESFQFDPDHAWSVYVDELGALAVYTGGSGIVVVAFDQGGSVDWVRDIPIGSDRVRSLFRLPDGTIAVTPVVSGADVGTGQATVAVSLRYNPESGSWSSAADDCDGLAGEAWISESGEVDRVDVEDLGEGSFGLEILRLSL